jgi:hypothetical protein
MQAGQAIKAKAAQERGYVAQQRLVGDLTRPQLREDRLAVGLVHLARPFLRWLLISASVKWCLVVLR